MKLGRRTFLKAGAAAGGGLVVELWFPRESRAAPPGPVGTLAPDAFLRVDAGGVTFVCPHVEMGQGILTGAAMLVAEELEIAPQALKVVPAPASRAYDNPQLRTQLTGGSASVKSSWETLRLAGATAREMLRSAAARRWGVPVDQCTASGGAVHHAASARRATYEELADEAGRSERPRNPALRTAGFKVIGQSLPRVEARPKVDGSGVFGIDVKVPDALVAVVVRCPVPGGKVKSFDAAPARAMPGVVDVVQIPSGVAVVAKGYWYAREAAAKLPVTWDEGPNAGLDSAAILDRYRKAAASGEGKRMRSSGDAAKALAGAARVVEAGYLAPFVAHATMEPQNATARVTPERCEIWAPTQGPGVAKEVARQITGYGSDQIVIHTTLVGGGFGRRIAQDYVAEAIWVSRATGRAVKVIWSREDDIRHDQYRPAAFHLLRGGLASDGAPVAWEHRVVTQSILSQMGDLFIPSMLPFWVPTGVKRGAASVAEWYLRDRDETSFEGAQTMPYAIPNLAVDFLSQEVAVPVGMWRSVGHSHTAFAVEGFADELAHAAGKDPYLFRRDLLAGAPRNRAVLDLVAERSGWSKAPPAGVGRGIAQHASFDSFAAAVAEVAVSGREIEVRRVVIAIDCGRAVNPNLVRAQLESSVVFGLSATLKHEITFERGRVRQGNFDDFEVVRMAGSPRVEAHVLPSDAAPTGVGEPGVPVVAPAVANAVFAATGRRLRRLPLSLAPERTTG
jgi:CO/xanthine dehydrogenase Mo-binding subunit